MAPTSSAVPHGDVPHLDDEVGDDSVDEGALVGQGFLSEKIIKLQDISMENQVTV